MRESNTSESTRERNTEDERERNARVREDEREDARLICPDDRCKKTGVLEDVTRIETLMVIATARINNAIRGMVMIWVTLSLLSLFTHSQSHTHIHSLSLVLQGNSRPRSILMLILSLPLHSLAFSLPLCFLILSVAAFFSHELSRSSTLCSLTLCLFLFHALPPQAFALTGCRWCCGCCGWCKLKSTRTLLLLIYYCNLGMLSEKGSCGGTHLALTPTP